MNADDIYSRYPFLAVPLECSSGWYPLIAELCAALDAMDLPDMFMVTQVKEKFGGLRFYVSSGDNDILDLIDEYEDRSITVCEICGKPGVLVERHAWWMTRCETCLQSLVI